MIKRAPPSALPDKGPTKPPTDELPWGAIAFLADVFDAAASNQPLHLRRDLEQTEPKTLVEILAALNTLGPEVRHYTSLEAFMVEAKTLEAPILFSTYGGPPSRSRLMLAPAAAESLGVAFVGLDAMGQAMAHDKQTTKRLAADCGLITPSWRVLRDEADIALCAEFPLPYVLKPIAEGSSIGISERNLIRDVEDGAKVARELMRELSQPVLMESFVGGREVSFVAIEAKPDAHTAFVECVVDGEPAYFDSNLFHADEKLHRHLPRAMKPMDEALSAEDEAAIQRLLRAIGHYGYIRVDGKFENGRFVFLELTPDAWLGERGQIAQGFIAQGWTYADVLRAILLSARLNNPNRGSSG